MQGFRRIWVEHARDMICLVVLTMLCWLPDVRGQNQTQCIPLRTSEFCGLGWPDDWILKDQTELFPDIGVLESTKDLDQRIFRDVLLKNGEQQLPSRVLCSDSPRFPEFMMIYYCSAMITSSAPTCERDSGPAKPLCQTTCIAFYNSLEALIGVANSDQQCDSDKDAFAYVTNMRQTCFNEQGFNGRGECVNGRDAEPLCGYASVAKACEQGCDLVNGSCPMEQSEASDDDKRYTENNSGKTADKEDKESFSDQRTILLVGIFVLTTFLVMAILIALYMFRGRNKVRKQDGFVGSRSRRTASFDSGAMLYGGHVRSSTRRARGGRSGSARREGHPGRGSRDATASSSTTRSMRSGGGLKVPENSPSVSSGVSPSASTSASTSSGPSNSHGDAPDRSPVAFPPLTGHRSDGRDYEGPKNEGNRGAAPMQGSGVDVDVEGSHEPSLDGYTGLNERHHRRHSHHNPGRSNRSTHSSPSNRGPPPRRRRAPLNPTSHASSAPAAVPSGVYKSYHKVRQVPSKAALEKIPEPLTPDSPSPGSGVSDPQAATQGAAAGNASSPQVSPQISNPAISQATLRLGRVLAENSSPGRSSPPQPRQSQGGSRSSASQILSMSSSFEPPRVPMRNARSHEKMVLGLRVGDGGVVYEIDAPGDARAHPEHGKGISGERDGKGGPAGSSLAPKAGSTQQLSDLLNGRTFQSFTPSLAIPEAPPPKGEAQLTPVARSFSPRLPDEIALNPGDYVTVEVQFRDGWGKGRNTTTGAAGVFPLFCLLGQRRESTPAEDTKEVES